MAGLTASSAPSMSRASERLASPAVSAAWPRLTSFRGGARRGRDSEGWCDRMIEAVNWSRRESTGVDGSRRGVGFGQTPRVLPTHTRAARARRHLEERGERARAVEVVGHPHLEVAHASARELPQLAARRRRRRETPKPARSHEWRRCDEARVPNVRSAARSFVCRGATRVGSVLVPTTPPPICRVLRWRVVVRLW